MYSIKTSGKLRKPALRPSKLLDQIRKRLRYISTLFEI